MLVAFPWSCNLYNIATSDLNFSFAKSFLYYFQLGSLSVQFALYLFDVCIDVFDGRYDCYVVSSSTLSSKDNWRYSKKWSKNKYVYLNEVIWLMKLEMRLEMKNRSRRYDINRPRSRHRHKYPKYKRCLDIMI